MPAPSPTDLPPSPPRKPAGRSQLQKSIMALARTVHIYITLFAFLGLLLYSVSGFLLHHDTWFAVSHKSHKDITLPPELVSVPEAKLDRFKVSELLRAQGKISGTVKLPEPQPGQPPDPSEGFMFDDKTIMLTFEGPSRTTDVTIYRAADDTHKIGDTHIEFEDHGLSGLLGDLHMGHATGPIWSLVIDLVSITLCLASLTGLLIWTQLTKRRTIGLICLLSGTAIIVGIYFFSVP